MRHITIKPTYEVKTNFVEIIFKEDKSYYNAKYAFGNFKNTIKGSKEEKIIELENIKTSIELTIEHIRKEKPRLFKTAIDKIKNNYEIIETTNKIECRSNIFSSHDFISGSLDTGIIRFKKWQGLYTEIGIQGFIRLFLLKEAVELILIDKKLLKVA